MLLKILNNKLLFLMDIDSDNVVKIKLHLLNLKKTTTYNLQPININNNFLLSNSNSNNIIYNNNNISIKNIKNKKITASSFPIKASKTSTAY